MAVGRCARLLQAVSAVGECRARLPRGCTLAMKELAANFAAAAMEIGKKDAELQVPLDVPSGNGQSSSATENRTGTFSNATVAATILMRALGCRQQSAEWCDIFARTCVSESVLFSNSARHSMHGGTTCRGPP
eukprot:TRINITY_DN2763_c0_g1_i5.p3 TRINITY_DN2763_c0_g1~~TRINITY_DN2763_c0_g1_i5.p3  ORF type:complete len:133 (-),score=2.95 TRINITY_DN2763_c0_g1_i5:137-535(-)